jgi:hypothetical protein
MDCATALSLRISKQSNTKQNHIHTTRRLETMNAFQEAQLIGQVERGILQVAEEEERKLDAKLKSIEQLGECRTRSQWMFLK